MFFFFGQNGDTLLESHFSDHLPVVIFLKKITNKQFFLANHVVNYSLITLNFRDQKKNLVHYIDISHGVIMIYIDIWCHHDIYLHYIEISHGGGDGKEYLGYNFVKRSMYRIY